MFFLLVILLLLLSVAFYQSLHGMFSAMIMTVLTLCCAALAIGSYEWVAVNWIAPRWKGDYALAVALASLFGVPLVVLRLAALLGDVEGDVGRECGLAHRRATGKNDQVRFVQTAE